MFQQFGLSEPILRAVASEGYTTPTAVQSQTIPHVLAGRDLFACAQTGTGKTAAFALPILQRLMHGRQESTSDKRQIRVLVLSPTRELAAQIGQSFQAYGRHTGLRYTVVFGGVGQQSQVRAIRQGIQILIATPGRLLDLVGQGWVDLSGVEVLVLDEADRMLDMGFLPDVRRVIAKLPVHRQTILFSATIPEAVERLADAILRDPMRIRVAPSKATPLLIEQSVYFVARQHKPQMLAEFLSTRSTSRVIVFTRTKRGADRLTRHLNRCGIRAAAMHGDKSQPTRQRTLADFKSSRMSVLVATDIAARGIDVEGISHVLNFDLPHEAETYVHRIGRTGRAGATGCAVSFCDNEEQPYLRAIERLIRRTLAVGQDLALRLDPPDAHPTSLQVGPRAQPTRKDGSPHPARPNQRRRRRIPRSRSEGRRYPTCL